jgi:hypothetical protein
MLRSDLLTHYGEQVTAPTGKELLDRFAAVLGGLGARHGLSNLRHGGAGTVVADVEAGRTYLDLARCELEAESLWGTSLTVVSSDAPRADRIVAGPLRSVDTA